MDGRYSGGLPKNFLQPCLLLLVLEQPGYGYDLVGRLKPLGINDDAASVYRALRLLEHDGAVTSAWRTSETGPARRVYRLTDTGEAMLREWVVALEDTSMSLARWLDRYALVTSRGDNGEAAAPAQPAPAG
jgi:PadR family transcriptional regulator, regulatory protein PadR